MDNPTHAPRPSAVTIEQPIFLTVPEAVRLSRLSRATLYQLIADKSVKSYAIRKTGNIRGKRLVSRESLVSYVESYAVTP